MKNSQHYRLLILGSGPAGCTAAIYAARAGLNFAMIVGVEQGGQITKTPKIANWPGEPNDISGAELMEKIMNQVRNFSANIVLDTITKADLSRRPFCLQGENPNNEYTCDALIIATGASPKFLGLPEEQKYLGRGVSTCAICDGFFYKNKHVVIVGGGNTAAEEALYLAKLATTVTLVHRRDTLRAEAWLVKQLQQTPNVKFEWNSVVAEILGNDAAGVTGVKLKNIELGASKTIEAAGMFIAIGYQPNTEIFSNGLEMVNGYIKTGAGGDGASAANIAGVFAAGDVVAYSYHQAIVAAGSGCTAVLDAKKFLESVAA